MMNHQFYQGHLINKHLGQNFLHDQFIIKSIISAINPKKGQILIEIGPGLAALTEPMAEYLDHLTVIELDKDLVNRLKSHSSISHKLTIYQQNVMTVNFKDLSKKIGYPLRLFGNLPYNISTEFIFYLFKYINLINDMHFMFQKEVANRLFSEPNNKTYSRLSIIAQYFCQIMPIIEIPSSSFFPIPKVDSTMVRLIPHTFISYPVIDINMLSLVSKKSFNQRRKKIKNSLKNLLTENELVKIGIDPKMRAENVSVIQYCQIANYVTQKVHYFNQIKK